MPLRDRDQRRSGRGADTPPPSDAARWQLWAASLGIAILLGGGGWLYYKSQSSIAMDPQSLCPISSEITEVAVVLLDLSSNLSEPQQADVQNQLTRIRNDLPRFGRIEIFTVDREGQRLIRPVLELCNPGRGEDMSVWYQNPELAQRRWEQAFAGTLQDAIDTLMATPEAAVSPIFEAVQATSLVSFDNPSFDGVERSRLVLVSDLMQNVPGKLRMYDGIPPFADFEKTPYFIDVKAKLAGVEVTLLYLQHPTSVQTWPRQIDFWRQYFGAQGATVERVVPISGAQ